MSNAPVPVTSETPSQKFERLLAQEPFKGLKAILDRLSSDRDARFAAAQVANSYDDLVARLGYKVTVAKQIHVQDSFSRTSPAGGVKAVLPYHDIPSQSSLPTLVHYDSSVTTTIKSSAFFNGLFAKLKAQLNGKS